MKYLHTMVRVNDVDASLAFYCEALGLEERHRVDVEAGRFTLIFLGAPGDGDGAQGNPLAAGSLVELTHNWDQDADYDKGNGWGHICVETPDVYKACEDLVDQGIKITRPAGPMKHGTRIIAFCEDPDGYNIELNESIVNTKTG